ncbi:MAG TPA: DUF2244 domain-containing protein [Burkholderiales bacterium]|nr:DUF2244 domain-containing protein [Burkholderiales bacterium]
MKRACNCSISPAGFLGVLVSLAVVTLAIGVGFALLGAWLVLPFAGLEVLSLGAAFVMYARRFGDGREKLSRIGEWRT